MWLSRYFDYIDKLYTTKKTSVLSGTLRSPDIWTFVARWFGGCFELVLNSSEPKRISQGSAVKCRWLPSPDRSTRPACLKLGLNPTSSTTGLVPARYRTFCAHQNKTGSYWLPGLLASKNDNYGTTACSWVSDEISPSGSAWSIWFNSLWRRTITV